MEVNNRPGHKGKLIIFSAPSGAGKTTIVRYLLSTLSKLEFSVSATSRKIRPGEINGKDYHFISIQDFKNKISWGEFLEWEEVYPDHFYGTLKSEVERIREKGKHVIFDVDVKGGLNIKKYYGNQALAVFVMPPDIETLEERLRGRLTETEENLRKRIGKAKEEIGFSGRFDVILVNDNLETACKQAEITVREFLTKK
ncbi:MAG: guanylate kinase [Bacteroidales bacterium]